MQIIGNVPQPEISDDEGMDMAEMQRLGLEKQCKQYTVDRAPSEGDPRVYLFGDGEMLLDFNGIGGPSVMLSRAETVALYVMLDKPSVRTMMARVLRASLLEHGGESAELVYLLDQALSKRGQQPPA